MCTLSEINAMRVSIIVTDDAGNSWEFDLPRRGSANPSESSPSPEKKRRTRKKTSKGGSVAVQPDGEVQDEDPAIDLSLPIRPFMNRYARGATGARKFALMVAHTAKGDLSAEVTRSDIEKQWSKMTGLLGEFNPAFSTRAKDSGWVDSPKFGVYKLLLGWKDGAH